MFCLHRQLTIALKDIAAVYQSLAMEQNNERNVVAASRKVFIQRQVYCLGISYALMFSAFAGVLSLQSSINIEAELGTTSLAAAYGTTVIWNLLFTSVMLRVLGPKKSILFSGAFYLVYTLANIYPSKILVIYYMDYSHKNIYLSK